MRRYAFPLVGTKIIAGDLPATNTYRSLGQADLFLYWFVFDNGDFFNC